MARFKKTHLPKQRRTIPLPASDRNSGREVIDAGKYYRCWNCGWICNVDRDALSEQGNGSNPVAVPEMAYGAGADPDGGVGSVTIVVDKVRMSALDSSGDPVAIKHSFQADGTGCPLCFSRAWKK